MERETSRTMRLRGARTNNLKNIDVDFPLKRMTVVTGLSGSGKSSLVFDTLYAEGQRRYVESLSTYIRQFLEKMPRPDIDGLDNVSPAIALEQKNHINNSRATVATMSEVYDYMRLLFGKVGKTHCLKCGHPVRRDTPVTVAGDIAKLPENSRFYVLAPLTPPARSGKAWAEYRAGLVGQGFERVVIDGEVTELTGLKEAPGSGKKAAELHLVIDRLARPAHPTNDGRLLDALEQAFAQGGDRAVVAFPPKEGKGGWEHWRFSSRFRCEPCGIDYRPPDPQLLSFNSPLGACPGCNGFGFTLEIAEDIVVPDKRRPLKAGAIDPFTKPAYNYGQKDLLKFCEKVGIDTKKRWDDLKPEERAVLWEGTAKGAKPSFYGVKGFFEELKGYKYKMHVRIFIRRYQDQRLCSQCEGARLRPEALAVKLGGKNIAQVLAMPIKDARDWLKGLELGTADQEIAKDVCLQTQSRLEFMYRIGVGYLTLNRLGKTLSGGECQRIYLASQLGNRLSSTLYVLDEPSIGLHAADTAKLVGLLEELRDLGNTVVVVEHDMEVMRSADYLVELGPHAGYKGGEVVAQGDFDRMLKEKSSLTAKYLTGDLSIPPRTKARPQPKEFLRLTGCSEHNLKGVDVDFPLKRLVCVTGLSGSGKTTLVHKTLYNALHRIMHKDPVEVGRFQRLYGADSLRDVVMLDQKPIGRSSRSNPATYLKIYDDVRKIYANQSLSLRRGYTPQHFSFNVDGGRCPVCKGEGEVTIDMHFMAELKLPCEECGGKRFKKDVLEVEFKKKSIYQLLSTTIDECIDLFREYLPVSQKLQVLRSVGLGYLQLGQSGTSLSGGESQRLKIASVLADVHATDVLYIFDEPTTGLHVDDVKRLIGVLQSLVDNGNSVVVIEHNLELIAQADHVIDLGPGAGEDGGTIVAAGSPEAVMAEAKSLTGKFLKKAAL